MAQYYKEYRIDRPDDSGRGWAIFEGDTNKLAWFCMRCIDPQGLEHITVNAAVGRTIQYVKSIIDAGLVHNSREFVIFAESAEEARTLALQRDELPRFRVTYTVHLEGTYEIEAATPESFHRQREEVYVESSLTNYDVLGHDEEWEPINVSAKALYPQILVGDQGQKASTTKIIPRQETHFVLSYLDIRTLFADHLGGPIDFKEVVVRSWVYDDMSTFDLFLSNYSVSSQEETHTLLARKNVRLLEDHHIHLLLLELARRAVLPEGSYLIKLHGEYDPL